MFSCQFLLLALLVLVHGDELFKETVDMKADLTCSVREDWCFNITIFSVKMIDRAPAPVYPRDLTILKEFYCSKKANANPHFKNIAVKSQYKEGIRVNYQLSHTCSSDGKPDCITPKYPYYIPFDEKDYTFAPHEVGIPSGRGECEN